MSTANQFVEEVCIETTRMLDLIEQAQAIAAALLQEYIARGGADFVAPATWENFGITQGQFDGAMYSFGALLPNILGSHATNLYMLKNVRNNNSPII